MVFSNTLFLFVFLPITLLLYYLSKPQYHNMILLIASLFFYAYGEPRMVWLMLASIICNYFFALGMEKYACRKTILIASVVYNLGVLFVFKYLGFSMRVFNTLFRTNITVLEIALPIGISFYTFQSLSYIIDVYRNRVAAQHNITDLGLYVSLFPQLIAGPIVRYNSIAEQIRHREISPQRFREGAKRFMCGFCKKVLIANNLARGAEYYFGNQPVDNSVIGAWIGSICFTLQIFYDFSGYSDMAIGLGKMLGFTFEENFNYPYVAKSITDFWRRWHISLSKWFRDYIYIPLGGSRVSVPRHIVNMAIVWFLTGLWHGAAFSFIAWGIMYFAALVIEKYIIKPETRHSVIFEIVYRIAILLYVNFGWVIFNANGLRSGLSYCLSMIGLYYGNSFIDATTLGMLREYGAFMIMGIVFSTPIAKYLSSKTREYFVISKILTPAGYLVAFLWAVSFLILGSHNPFIYFNF